MRPGNPRVVLSPCDVPGTPALAAKCGVLRVAENPDRPDDRRIDVRILVMEAESPDKALDPIFYFEGGPGGSSVEVARTIAEYVLPKARRERDLVFVEQRGTGRSNALRCPTDSRADLARLLTPGMDAETKQRCLAAIGAIANPRFYGTAHAADDVELVRRALGYGSINLLGSSYGSRLALRYLARYGVHVRSAVLVSVDPLDMRAPLTTATDTEAALQRVMAGCGEDAACRAAYPRIAEDLAVANARLQAGPVEVTIEHPITHRPETAPVTRDLFAASVRAMLYEPEGHARLPQLLRRAADGDYAFFAQRYAAVRANAAGTDAEGLLYTITCSEDFDFADLEAARRSAAPTFYGDVRIHSYADICAGWPRASVPRDFFAPVEYGGPVLLFSGELDPVTPPYFADAVARHMPRARHIVFAHDAHNVGESWPGCAQNLVAEFYGAADASDLDARCAQSVVTPSWRLPPS